MSILKIQVDEYVKCVLLKQFGAEPIFAAQNTVIGQLIRPLLKDQSEATRHLKTKPSTTIDILLPARLQHLKHNKKENQAYFLHEEDSVKLTYALKKFVDFLLVHHITTAKAIGMPTMKAIDSIYKVYNLNEDIIPSDTIMCLYKRSSHKQEEKVKKYNSGGRNCP